MPISPVLAKDFVMEMQVYTYRILRERVTLVSHTNEEILDISNEIVEYAFGLMLRTHTDKQLRFKFDDDTPF